MISADLHAVLGEVQTVARPGCGAARQAIWLAGFMVRETEGTGDMGRRVLGGQHADERFGEQTAERSGCGARREGADRAAVCSRPHTWPVWNS